MMDFDKKPTIDKESMICHSGGAVGSDTIWSNSCKGYNIPTRAYSYKTPSHTSGDKVEISDFDFTEGVDMVKKANKSLNRYGISKYINLLSRNWSQVKYSDQLFAIGELVKANSKSKKGYLSKSKYTTVSGGTGWAVQMAIDKGISIYVYEQNVSKWFTYSYSIEDFIEYKQTPIINFNNFAGVGTREINDRGEKAINDVLKETFK